MPGIPSPLRVLGLDITAEINTRKQNTSLENRYGYIDHHASRIVLRDDLTPSQERETLWHELLHAAEDACNLELDEDVIARLARATFAILRDNPELLAWFGESEGGGAESGVPLPVRITYVPQSCPCRPATVDPIPNVGTFYSASTAGEMQFCREWNPSPPPPTIEPCYGDGVFAGIRAESDPVKAQVGDHVELLLPFESEPGGVRLEPGCVGRVSESDPTRPDVIAEFLPTGRGKISVTLAKTDYKILPNEATDPPEIKPEPEVTPPVKPQVGDRVKLILPVTTINGVELLPGYVGTVYMVHTHQDTIAANFPLTKPREVTTCLHPYQYKILPREAG